MAKIITLSVCFILLAVPCAFAQLTVQPSGDVQLDHNLQVTGNVTAASVTASGVVSGAALTATTTVTAPTLSATEDVRAPSVTATDIVVAPLVKATGSVFAPEVIATGSISAPNINASSILSGQTVHASNVHAADEVSAGVLLSAPRVEATQVDATSVVAGSITHSDGRSAFEVPAGTVITWAGLIDDTHPAPEGWLPCDGRALSSAQYPRLFAAIGQRYGNGTKTTVLQKIINLDSLGHPEYDGVGYTLQLVADNAPDTDFNLPITGGFRFLSDSPSESELLNGVGGSFYKNVVRSWHEDYGEDGGADFRRLEFTGVMTLIKY